MIASKQNGLVQISEKGGELKNAGAAAHSPSTRVPRGGRPTRAAAKARHERMLEIATTLFLTHGFEATSIERLAEAAGIGKATLYARYHNKGALFAAVIRRRILQIYEPLRDAFAKPDGRDLPTALALISRVLLQHSLSPQAVAIGRILAAQALNFPELAELAVREGLARQLDLIGTVLKRFQDNEAYELGDIEITADLFHAVVLGRIVRLATYGAELEPEWIERRTQAAIELFVRGIRAHGAPIRTNR